MVGIYLIACAVFVCGVALGARLMLAYCESHVWEKSPDGFWYPHE